MVFLTFFSLYLAFKSFSHKESVSKNAKDSGRERVNVTADSFAIDSFMILFLFLFIPNITFALNSFGLEAGTGIARYTLFPPPP